MSDEQHNPEADLEFVEIYATHNFVEFQILEDLFEDHGLQYMARLIESSPLPMSVGQHGERRIAVPQAQIEKGLHLIKQAIADDAIQVEEGEFLVTP